MDEEWVRIDFLNHEEMPAPGAWPLKPYSFGISVATHILVVLALVQLPEGALTAPAKRADESVIVIPKEKVYWYPMNRTKPSLTPDPSVPVAAVSSGEIQRATESVVVRQPEAQSRKQMIWQPDTPARVTVDTPLPDMVAIREKPQPKPFIPPAPKAPPAPPQPAIAQPEAIPQQPAVAASAVAVAPLPTRKPAPKTFVAPKEQPRLPQAPAAIAEAPPVLAGTPAAGVTAAVPAGLGGIPNAKAPAKAFVPPPARTAGNGRAPGGAASVEAAPEMALAGTGAAMTAVVIGVNPVQSAAPPPVGSRAGEFSIGATAGAPAAVRGAGGVTVPGVAVRGSETRGGLNFFDPPAPNPAAPRFELRLPASSSSISAPLRPGSRTVPRSIEALFADRILYTMVVARPNLTEYTGDWTIWFAEKPGAGLGSVQMRAPLPARKALGGAIPATATAAKEGFVQVAATIGADGRISRLAPLPGRTAGLAEKAAHDLGAWEFRPATRNGSPVPVDVVIELFFRAP